MSKIDIAIDSFESIIFDFDGVLAESADVKTDAFVRLFSPYGEEIVKKVVKHHIENGGISRYKKIEYYYSDYLNTSLSKSELDDIAKKFSEIVLEKIIKVPMVKGVKKFLKNKYKNIDLYIASGTPQDELEFIVKKRGIEKYFKGIFGTPDTKDYIINRLISKNNYNRKKVLYIGDSLSDYYAAQKTMIKFLGRVPKGIKSMFPNDIPAISNFFDII